ncbi:MAG: helix-turn-helix transcriptional regulator [Alkalibacterium sp.]|nr:helix-turn-helix transcriptional regulator [Alkalibacterium sp.]
MAVGELIKNRRKDLNMTQGELAEGICTQAMVSKIERGDLEPNGNLIEKLSKKLRVTVSYFYGEESIYSQDNFLITLKNLIYEELNQSHMDRVDMLMETNKDLIKLATALEDIYFFEWVSGSLYFFKDRNSKRAIETLERIPLDNIIQTDLAIDIINTLGSIYSHMSEPEKALVYFEKANLMQNKQTSIQTSAKLIYNFAFCLMENKLYKRALAVTLQGIDIIVEKHSLLSLGRLYWLKGRLFYTFDQYEEAIDAYKAAVMIFKIEKNEHLRALVLIDLQEAIGIKGDSEVSDSNI